MSVAHPTVQHYHRVAVGLHWAIAAFIVVNLVLGSFMESLAPDLRGVMVRLHESFGFTVCVLTLVRIAWRLTHRPPPAGRVYAPWERALAIFTHGFLYALMLFMPVTGWLLVSSNLRRPMIIYGLWMLPPYAPLTRIPAGAAKTVMHDNFVLTHTVGAWIFVALIALHVAGALKHQFLDREPLVRRMWFP
jgi:cytochrome b561